LVDLEVFTVAFTNLKRQRLRSYLTLLGMVIGIAAIVALFTLSTALSITIEEQFEIFGLDVIFVEPGQEIGFSTAVSRGIEEEDIDIIKSIPGVEEVMGFYETAAIAKYRDQELSAFIIGYDPNKGEYLEQTGYIILNRGRLLEPNDLHSVMISESFAENALGNRDLELKQKLEIDGMEFRIVGILEDADIATAGFINFFWVTKKAAQTLFDEEDPVELIVKVTDEHLVDEVSEKIEIKLEDAHGEKDFYVATSETLLESFSNVLGIVQIVLMLLASISVVVGAIGIMNTMLMAVLERTREIGAMKAIGATNNLILGIFIAEAGLLGMVGGAIGIVIGYLTATGISLVAGSLGFGLPIVVDPFVIIFGILVSMGVGIISGVIPARRAAKMDPVEALRYE
tara:strand:+ start:47 stop:1243 length:1197 start_codon:yes stop_codon:yes gene_type:complete